MHPRQFKLEVLTWIEEISETPSLHYSIKPNAMKALITLFISFLFAEIGFAQVIVDETDLNTVENVTYIEVTCQKKKARTFIAYINYGQSGGGNDLTQVNTPDKKAKEFTNEMAVLNFLAINGWELKQIITVPSMAIPNTVEMMYVMVKKQR